MDRRPPRARAVALAAALALPALLGACAHAAASLRCEADATPMRIERLYFGTQRPDGGTVSDAEWRTFLDEVVAPAFPAGFTAWDAAGGWRGADRRPVREDSHVLEVAHDDPAGAGAAIAGVVAAYRARFGQESVMRASMPACVAF